MFFVYCVESTVAVLCVMYNINVYFLRGKNKTLTECRLSLYWFDSVLSLPGLWESHFEERVP